jgi:hypothetical protein
VDQDGAVQEMNANSLTLAQRPSYLTLAEPPSVWLKFLVTAIQADKDQAQKTIASFLAGSTGKDDGALLRTALIGGRELERRPPLRRCCCWRTNSNRAKRCAASCCNDC